MSDEHYSDSIITLNDNCKNISKYIYINLLNSETSAKFINLMSSYCFKPHIPILT